MPKIFSRANMFCKVAARIGRPFPVWEFKLFIESGRLKDYFIRVGGRRLFVDNDIARIVRLVEEKACRKAVRERAVRRGRKTVKKDVVHAA